MKTIKAKTAKKTKTQRLNLPNKPSELIRVALKDLSRVERLKSKYKIDMETWHEPNSHCKVCFAGSVMTRVCEPNEYMVPYDSRFTAIECSKFEALNYFRIGHIEEALNILNVELPFGVKEEIDVCDYGIGPTLFKEDMKKIANLLAKFNL